MEGRKPMIGGLQGLGANPKANLYASFDEIRLQLASLKETASRDDSAEAKDAQKDISHFVGKLEENGLWDYLVQLREEARDGKAI